MAGRKADLARHAELTQLYDDIARAAGETAFLGYETTTADARVAAIVRDGTSYQELEARPEAELRVEAGASAELVLDLWLLTGTAPNGRWTSERLAAANLGGTGGPRRRLGWERPERRRRRRCRRGRGATDQEKK